MQCFFQAFLPTAQAIKAIIKEKKHGKIAYEDHTFKLNVVTGWNKAEREQSAKEFFLFVKRKVAPIDIPSLPLGERAALLEIVNVLEMYIKRYLWGSSKVKDLLNKELFSLKLGGMIPRNYLEGESRDIAFIKQNDLADVLFTHGIALRFDPERGVAFPVISSKELKYEIFFSDLKVYDLDLLHKYYYEGEYLFSTDRNGLLIDTPKIQNQSISVHNKIRPFIVYKSGYPSPSVDVYHRDRDFYVVLHDGEGRVYRAGVCDRRIAIPDKYAYLRHDGFSKVTMCATKEMIDTCVDLFHRESIADTKKMIQIITKTLQFKKQYLKPVASRNKFISYFFLPKILLKVIWREVSWKALFMPWKAQEVEFEKLGIRKGDPSKM